MVADDRIPFVPGRGDIVWIDLNPARGHEQAGRRPAVVVSPDDYNRRVGLALMCPITSHIKGYPFEVPLPTGGCVVGAVLCDQVRSVAWRERNASLAGRLSDDRIRAVIERIASLIS